MGKDHTTIAVERYLNELSGIPGSAPAEPVVRELLAASVNRLHMLCTVLLRRHYRRLTKPPLNLDSEELLGSVVERMIRALRSIRPPTVRQFFALAHQHMRWELNDLARKVDGQPRAVQLRESVLEVPGPRSEATPKVNPNIVRIMQAIESLPEVEKETFCLVRVQGMTHVDAAAVLGVSVKTVSRRLNRTLPLLVKKLRDSGPNPKAPE